MIKLVNATVNDIDFCINLRNDPENSRFFFSKTTITKEMQKNFIEKEKHFYIIWHEGEPIGTISLYNLEQDKAEWGRYIIIKKYHNTILPVLAEIVLLCKAFVDLGLKSVYCNTKIENILVWKQHKKLGFRTLAIKDGSILQEICPDEISDLGKKIINNYLR